MKKYRIYDRKAKCFVGGEYASRVRARRRVDKLDNEYGGYRYCVKEVI